MTTTDVPVFAGAALLYHQAGWPAVLPVPPETKSPPPTGYTGAEGLDTPAELLASWASGSYAAYSCALRMPDGVIGIDVDQYTTAAGRVKRGAETLAKLVDRWGPLPATWTSTARGADGPSRIAFYRVPAGRYVSVLQPDIEIIQRHHRYAVVWPSLHSELGTIYTWYAPDGTVATRLPSPTDFAWAPEAWAVGLSEGASAAAPASASHASGDALLAALSVDARPACSVMYDALEAAARVLAEQLDSGTRHDAMTKRIHRIVQTAAMGHPGLGAALPGLREQWTAITSGESREAEFDRMLLSSARKAVTVLGGVQQLGDPCSMFGGAAWAGLAGMQVDARPRPSDDREFGEDSEPFEPLHLKLPPKLIDPSWGQVIGTEPFDPGVDLDHPLADAMLRRSFYMVRRASDTKTAWLQRGAEQWTLEGDLAGRIVSECAVLMPDGDPEPIVKGMPASPAQRAYKRRLRMMTNGPAAAVAATIRRQTDGGRHPATVAVADLDREPDVLWAGGWPWDLRASTEVPTLAAFVDPHQPHLVAAGVTPNPIPTPRWDAFVAAVWPDADVRAWALRVLSIAFTGYPDAALPLLYGEGGTGKTSLITLLMEVLGSYAHAANPKLLSDRADQFMTYQLKGRRLSFIDEAMREGHRNAETLKQLTGGGALSGSAKYQNEITFQPTHTLVLTSNTPPTVSDAAVRRRIRLLPCDGDAAEVRARRQALGARHWAVEAPGVLAAMMREAGAWLADPTTALVSAAPLSVQFLLGELVSSQDVIGQWLTESVMPDQVGTPSHRLYVGFRGWCRDAGIRDGAIATETAWALALTQLGFDKVRRRDANYRLLVVRPDPGFAFTPSTPTPGASSTPSTPPPGAYPPHASGVEGSWNQGGASDGQPSTTQNPSSTPLFTTSVEGVEGRSNTLKNEVSKKGPIEERTENLRTLFELPSPSTDDLHKQGVTSEKEAVEAPPHSPHASTIAPTWPNGAENTASETPSDLRKQASAPRTPAPREINASEVAARAYQGQATKQLTKAEARKQMAAEKRAAAIAEAITAAQGEVLALPVVVDRPGHLIPVTPEQAHAVIAAAVERAGALTVDVETSGYPVGHELHTLRSVQLGDEVAAVVLDPTDEAQRAVITATLAAAPVLHAHSASADLAPLAHAGLIDAGAAWARMHDTVIPAKLADPRSTGSDPGLKQLADAVLGAASVSPAAEAGRLAVFKAGRWVTGKQRFAQQLSTPIGQNGWANINTGSAAMLRYSASDVLDTAALARRLPPIPEPILGRERLAEEMTARVTHRGLRIDAERVAELSAEHESLRAQADARIAAFGVQEPNSRVALTDGFTRLGVTLPRTEKGNVTLAKSTLATLARMDGPAGELASAVTDWRHSNTVLTLFLAPYSLLCAHGDGRVRPTIYTLGTDTGRMSSVRPNAQQLPRAGGVRSIYRADPGFVFVSADFSGVELRGAAALSQDPVMLRLIAAEDDFNREIALRAQRDGVSPKEARSRILVELGQRDGGAADGFHWVVARQAFGADATKEHRYTAKRGVFGTFYGGGTEALAEEVGVPVEEMAVIRGSLRDLCPHYFGWSNHMQTSVRQGHTQMITYSGRIIHFPATTPHKAPAYAIQGSCRELLVDALVRWRDTRWGDATLLPVHDELVVQVPEEDAEAATAELVRCMEGDLNGVRIIADPSEPSPFWQDSV